MYLVDTNIISELRKGDRTDRNVAAWFASVSDDDLYLSVVVLGEIRKGIELARPKDAHKAERLENWLADVVVAFGGRILPIDVTVMDLWGRMNAVRLVPVIDSLLAATAQAHQLTLVTRNDKDVVGLGAEILNPFKPA
jgi:toxin FitB